MKKLALFLALVPVIVTSCSEESEQPIKEPIVEEPFKFDGLYLWENEANTVQLYLDIQQFDNDVLLGSGRYTELYETYNIFDSLENYGRVVYDIELTQGTTIEDDEFKLVMKTSYNEEMSEYIGRYNADIPFVDTQMRIYGDIEEGKAIGTHSRKNETQELIKIEQIPTPLSYPNTKLFDDPIVGDYIIESATLNGDVDTGDTLYPEGTEVRLAVIKATLLSTECVELESIFRLEENGDWIVECESEENERLMGTWNFDGDRTSLALSEITGPNSTLGRYFTDAVENYPFLIGNNYTAIYEKDFNPNVTSNSRIWVSVEVTFRKIK